MRLTPRMETRIAIISWVRRTIETAKSCLFGEILQTHDGLDPRRESSLFAVYVNYDSYGLIHRYVVEQVQALEQAGFRVIFVTQSPKVRRPELVLPHCAKVIHRRNLGLDFGAYRLGLNWIREVNPSPRAVLLTNDSCYGYFSSIEGLESHVAEGGADLWGLTDSFQIGYHLQSYFLLISKRLFEAPSFWNFWRRMPINAARDAIVSGGEVGLTQSVLRNGFRTGVLVPYQDLVGNWLSERRPHYGSSRVERNFKVLLEGALITATPMNPTHYFWEALVEDYRLPLLKRDLLKKNPERIPNLHKTADLIRKNGGDFSSTIDHLRFRDR